MWVEMTAPGAAVLCRQVLPGIFRIQLETRLGGEGRGRCLVNRGRVRGAALERGVAAAGGGRGCRGGEFSRWGLALRNEEGAAVATAYPTRHYAVI